MIGRVVFITEPKVIQVNSNPQRLIDFVIEEESRLMITLWDKHVDYVMPYYNADFGRSTYPYTTVDGEVRISSSYTATKILFNYEFPKFLTFKERYCDNSKFFHSVSYFIASTFDNYG
nr:replication factor A protein 1-like [Ipomoea batatas]